MGVYTLARGKGAYEGEWRNGKAHGVGKFTGPTGEEVRFCLKSPLGYVFQFHFSQVEGVWDNGSLKPPPSGTSADATTAAFNAEDSYDDSFDDGVGGSGNGSEEDDIGEVGSERDSDRPQATEASPFKAPPASALPLYDVTSSQFVVHVQQQPSNIGTVGQLQGPNRPVKVKKTTTPSFIGLKLRLKVRMEFSYVFFCLLF
jgi:hypothetical protein